MSEKELRMKRDDPHNPKRLLDRKRKSSGDGYDQDMSNWKPTKWNDSGAGKGDGVRPISISQEEYGLKYDLATGRISKKEFDKQMKELGFT
jgi:hypothetical protein